MEIRKWGGGKGPGVGEYQRRSGGSRSKGATGKATKEAYPQEVKKTNEGGGGEPVGRGAKKMGAKNELKRPKVEICGGKKGMAGGQERELDAQWKIIGPGGETKRQNKKRGNQPPVKKEKKKKTNLGRGLGVCPQNNDSKAIKKKRLPLVILSANKT